MHTILNVSGRSKDNLKSRLDFSLICSRVELYLTGDGRAPVSIFRLSSEGKSIFFNWVSTEVKFPDGYVSKLSKSVEQGKIFSGMKSHDCHVFMQRLLPFAFAEFLPTKVHESFAGSIKFKMHKRKDTIRLFTQSSRIYSLGVDQNHQAFTINGKLCSGASSSPEAEIPT